MNRSVHFITLNILASFFSFLLLPMDPQDYQAHKSKDTLRASFQMAPAAKGLFSALPQEILIPILVTLAPEGKNSLRKTNKTFSILLSRENPQFFMFCKELYATACDKVCLGIKMIDVIGRKTNSWKVEDAYATSFLDNSCSVIGERGKLTFDLSVPCLSIETTFSQAIGIRPCFIIPSLTRCPYDIKLFFDQISEKELQTLTVPEWLLSFFIQNDDANSLELIYSQKICKKDINASKLLQLAIFCASPKVIPRLFELYNKHRTKNSVNSFNVGHEIDYLGIFLGYKKILEQAKSLEWVFRLYHSLLVAKHTNNKDNYYECIRQLFNNEFIRTLVPAVPKQKKDTKKIKTKTNCIII